MNGEETTGKTDPGRRGGGLSLVGRIASYIARRSERKFAKRYPSYHRLYKNWKNEYVGGYEALPDPEEIIEIDPATVHYYTTEGMYYWHYELAGEVRGGEWDRNVRPISEHIRLVLKKQVEI